MSSINFADFVDIRTWVSLQNKFSKRIKNSICTVDSQLNEITSSGELPYIHKLLIKADPSYFQDRINLKNQPETFNLDFGLKALTVPVLSNGHPICWLIIYTVRTEGEINDYKDLRADEIQDAINNLPLLNSTEYLENTLFLLSDIILEFSRDKKKSEKQLQRLNLFNKINGQIENSFDINTIGTSIVNSFLTSQLNIIECSVVLTNGMRYASKALTPPYYRLAEEVVLSQMGRTRNFVLVGDLAKDFTFKGIKGIEQANYALLALPILSSQEVLGVLSLYYDPRYDPTNTEVDFFKSIAFQVGKVLSNAQRYQQTEVSAHTDKLTGLNNRRYFMDFFTNELQHCAEAESPFSLLLFDIDDFKNYNDKCGHPAGDRALQKIGEIIRSTIRKQDVAGRYGGEEFIIILPNTKAEESIEVAERIRLTVQNTRFEKQEEQPMKHMSISIGGCTCMNSSITTNDMIIHADRALYQAKSAGKNQVKSLLVLDKSLQPIDMQAASELGRKTN